ncbi:hypothetical protein R1flu_020150 [Riccia fluitans]|uniref:Uncharacterized protein n=1 Tax=Riccia fluitans TaxID=41844 RepID=A0ABD1ZKP4_9MARC
MEGSQEREEKPFVLKRSLHRPRHAVKTVATAAVAAVANGREGNSKENSRETSSTSSDSADAKSTSPSAGKGSGSAGRGESEFKPSFKRSYSMNMIMTKAKKSVAQLVDYDDKSETTVDNTVVRSISSRRSPGRSSPRTAAGVERERESPGEEERRVKKDKYGSTRTTATTSAGAAADCGEKLKAASPTTSTALLQESSTREASGNSIRKTNDRKENGGGGSVRTVAAAVDSKLPGRILNGGCSNGAEVVRERDQFTRHGSGSGRSVIPLRKSQSFRLLQQQQQYSEQSRLVTRPNAMIGKSKVAYPLETPKTPRRFADLKNSKLRRSSSSPRVSGVHFKCLSDILC